MPGTATDRLKIDVSPRISAAPAVVRIRATVTPSSENRGLKIVADSGDYLRSSFVPPAPIQELRDLTRTRKQLVGEIARHTLRMQKALEDANLKPE